MTWWIMKKKICMYYNWYTKYKNVKRIIHLNWKQKFLKLLTKSEFLLQYDFYIVGPNGGEENHILTFYILMSTSFFF